MTLVYLYHINRCGHHKKLSIAKLDFVQVCGLSLNFYNNTLRKFYKFSDSRETWTSPTLQSADWPSQQTILPASSAPKSVLSWSISISRILEYGHLLEWIWCLNLGWRLKGHGCLLEWILEWRFKAWVLTEMNTELCLPFIAAWVHTEMNMELHVLDGLYCYMGTNFNE